MKCSLDRLAGTVFLPDVCPGCSARPIVPGEGYCSVCASGLRPLPPPRCRACGGSVDGILAVCGECLAGDERPWTQAVSVYDYGGFVRELVHRLKYGGVAYLAPALACAMADAWRTHGDGSPDIVTFVPMHWLRQFWRGYNQAELLARLIGRTLATPSCRLLKRKRWVRKQVSLGRADRQRNVTGAFAVVRPERVRGRRVLLVDDVFTTGSTLEAVARELATCEPAELNVLTLARG